MIASVEKNKLVYVLNRNAQAQLTISSPLEAHKAHALVFALVGLDVGYENPIFAALEVDYGDAEQDPSGQAYAESEKKLVYYELDLGLNHVVRKWSDAVDRSANMLFQVPGGADGPSGALVCSEEFITYRHSNQDIHRVAIPRRQGATEDPGRKRYITCGVVHRLRGQFFFLLQTEDGDIWKLTFEMVLNAKGEPTADVARIKLKYFDTIPPATSLCILKIGFLMVTMETGIHHWYQIASLGEDDDTKEIFSDQFSDPTERYKPTYFHPRAPAENVILTEHIPSLNPLMGLKAANLTNEDAPQLYSISGTGARSSLTTLKHGLTVLDLVDSGLGQRARNVWTVPLRRDDTFDAYAIIAMEHATVVLEIKDEVEQTDNTGILTTVQTLAVQQMGEDSLVQVHSKGIRHIAGNGGINDWPAPTHRTILAAAANVQQIAVALSSGEIVYFEMDSDGSLNQFEETKAMTATVTSLGLGPVPEGRIRSPWLAVGCDDQTVRILSLDPESTLQSKSVQALSNVPSSLCVMFMEDYSSGGNTMYLHIGLLSGIYIRTILDEITGELSDTRTRFLGSKPIKLRPVRLGDQSVILALTTRSWVGYTDEQTRMFTLAPLDFPQLESASGFHSAGLQYGIIGIQNENLR
jgi:splicing factor 3B subunit 3